MKRNPQVPTCTDCGGAATIATGTVGQGGAVAFLCAKCWMRRERPAAPIRREAVTR